MFTIVTHGHIPKWIIGLHVAFAEWLRCNHHVPHEIKVHLVPRPAIKADDVYAYGVFDPSEPCIYLTTDWAAWKRGGTVVDRSDAINFMLDTFAHEYVEYERWREGKPRNHRGIDARTGAMIRRFTNETFPTKGH